MAKPNLETNASPYKSAAADVRFGRDLIEAKPKLLRVARCLTRDPAEVDDLVQETFARAWRFREQFTPGTNLAAWLKCILRNRHRAVLRRRSLEQRYFVDAPHADQARDGAQYEALVLKDLGACLHILEPQDAQAILMAGVQGHSYDHAASELGLNCGTFKSRLSRARRRLADRLDGLSEEKRAAAA